MIDLHEFLATLDRRTASIGCEELQELVRSLMLDPADLRPHVRFDSNCYQRNLIRGGAHYQALFLCWKSGQRSPIHDHRGSACCVRVIRGVATETQFEFGPCGLVYPTQTHHHQIGDICASFDDDMHQMGNIQPAGSDLITLHIYSPPLLSMRTYFLGDSVLGECDDARAAAIRVRRKRAQSAAALPELLRIRKDPSDASSSGARA